MLARIASLVVLSATASLVGCTAAAPPAGSTDDAALTSFTCSEITNDVGGQLGVSIYRDPATGDVVYAPNEWFVDAMRFERPVLNGDPTKPLDWSSLSAPVSIAVRLDGAASDADITKAIQAKYPNAKITRTASKLELGTLNLATTNEATEDGLAAPWSTKIDGATATISGRIPYESLNALAAFGAKKHVLNIVSANVRVSCGGGVQTIHPQTSLPTYTGKGIEIGNSDDPGSAMGSALSELHVIDSLLTRTDVPRVVSDAELAAFHAAIDPKVAQIAAFQDGSIDDKGVQETAKDASGIVRALVQTLLTKKGSKLSVDAMITAVNEREGGVFFTPIVPADDNFVRLLQDIEDLETFAHTFATQPFDK